MPKSSGFRTNRGSTNVKSGNNVGSIQSPSY